MFQEIQLKDMSSNKKLNSLFAQSSPAYIPRLKSVGFTPISIIAQGIQLPRLENGDRLSGSVYPLQPCRRLLHRLGIL